MHLLNAHTRSLEYFIGSQIPKYAILSHTWGEDEVTMQDLANPEVHLKKGYAKIVWACGQALVDRLHYAWVDTCCIDKTSSAELSEAINSMFNWYSRAERCYAYLEDIVVSWKQGDEHGSYVRTTKSDDHDGVREIRATSPSFELSRWFTRGWTLQELIAPSDVFFFAFGWNFIGRRNEERLLPTLSKRTGIDQAMLQHRKLLGAYSVAQRMSWAAFRETTRKEDEAYCLLGIFGINMPLLYGEEGKAFKRLQEEIIRSYNEQSILAWSLPPARPGLFVDDIRPALLAPSPHSFQNCSEIEQAHRPGLSEPFQITSMSLSISMPLIEIHESRIGSHIGVLQCHHQGSYIGLWLRKAFTECDPLRKYEDAFSLVPGAGRLVKVDVEDGLKAESRRIKICCQFQADPGRKFRFSSAMMWFRLRNHHSIHRFSLRDVWPPERWKVFEEARVEYRRGSLLAARLDILNGLPKVGGVILVDERSQRRYAVCFSATYRDFFGGFRLADPGNRSLEDCCVEFEKDRQWTTPRTLPATERFEQVQDIMGSATIRVVMYVARLVDRSDVAVEVNIDDPTDQSHGSRDNEFQLSS